MARQRFRRKDLKRPDEFVSRGNQFIDWARNNTRMLIQVGAGVLVVGLIIAGVLSAHSARTRQANEDFATALAAYHSRQLRRCGEKAG